MIVTTIAMLMQAATTPAAAPVAAKPAAKEKMVCITESVLGSRLGGHRVCRTAAQWEQDRRDSQGDVDRAQRLSRQPGQDG